jgi:beta-lactamase class A
MLQRSRWPAYACVLTALLVFGLMGAPDPAGTPGPARAPGAADAFGPAAIPRPAAPPKPAGTPAPVPARGAPGICTSPAHSALAATLSRRIASALRGLSATVGIAADDPEQGIRCRYHQWRAFHSASVIKVIILGALLYQLHGYRNLSSYEADLAEVMITDSDNDAADALWNEVGAAGLQRFLTAAQMNHTVLGQYDYWGLTEVNAHDELRLLHLLITRNTVLDAASRRYALALMADVTPEQRWGVSAGAPSDVTVHLKNGWLPDPDLWDVNSIGDFTRDDLDYSIAILTSNDPDMAYGVATVETVARLINRALAKGTAEGAGREAGPSPEPFRHLLYMQRRFVR